MELSNTDIRAIRTAVRHLERMFEAMPGLPFGMRPRHHDTWRLLRKDDIPRLKRILEKWQQSTGVQKT